MFTGRKKAVHNTRYIVQRPYNGKAAVVSHGLVKEKQVPVQEIELAIRRRMIFAADPETHTCKG